MPININYKFLSDLEGGCQTTGYVPAVGKSKSGVTIATGCDLGQRNEGDLNSLKLDEPIIAKLVPYLGTTGENAQALLNEMPLVISIDEAQAIDQAVKVAHVEKLKVIYDNEAGNKIKFIDIPPEAQTAIMSVSFQYGLGLNVRTPKFWKAVTAQNWAQAIHELNNFGDAYPTRRRKEAALMETIKRTA